MGKAEPTVLVVAPAMCGEAELAAFVALVVSGGEVARGGLLGRVKKAKLLAFLRDGEKVIGVAGLKHPSANHRKEVSEGAEHHLPTGEFPLELGWVFVLPEARGGMSPLLCTPLLDAVKGQGVFATSRADNLAMHSTLGKLGFESKGRDYPSVQVPDTKLKLFVRPASQPSAEVA